MKQFESFALELARASGDLIKTYYGNPTLQVDRKKDDSPVTIADQEAEILMRNMIHEQFPEHGIIGEEMGSENEHAEFVWVLDPIDGTVSFVTPMPLFTTLIALLHHGEPVLGIIHQPILQQLCMGNGKETTLNGELVCVRETAETVSDAFLSGTYVSEVWKYRTEPEAERYLKLIRKAQAFKTWGDGYGYLMLAAGWIDGMMDPIMNPWDIAPLKPIIEGAGGIISDWHGNSAIGANSCVASTPRLHKIMIEMLNNG